MRGLVFPGEAAGGGGAGHGAAGAAGGARGAAGAGDAGALPAGHLPAGTAGAARGHRARRALLARANLRAWVCVFPERCPGPLRAMGVSEQGAL